MTPDSIWTSRPLVTFAALALFALPALHPLLIPYTGVTSHLLWWIHVAAIAQLGYLYGSRGALLAMAGSFILVIGGERLFGAGYGQSASWETAVSLAVALALTNSLIAALSVWAGHAAGRLQRAAYTHPLTGLPSRASLDELLDASGEDGASLIFVDLDDFDTINYSLGHSAGDQVLREIGKRLQAIAGSGFRFAHWAGDKFALFRSCDGDQGLDILIGNIRRALRQPILVEGVALNTVTAGIGMALQEPGVRREELARMADTALSHAKNSGSSGFCCFSQDMQRAAHERLATLNDLNAAVEAGEIEVFYQPIHHTTDGTIAGLEALVRWTHPQRGPISPGVFIPMAERAGIIHRLGEAVMQRAMRDFSQCREKGLLEGNPVLNINLSPLQLLEPGFVDNVLQAAERYRIDHNSLALEITETAMMQSEEASLAVLQELADHGIRLAIDDFGSGYSSLNYLHRLPVQVLKIDRELVEQLCDERPPLIRPIIEIADVFGFTVIAEGVETARQVSHLQSLGADCMQGFHLSRPMSLATLQPWLAKGGNARKFAAPYETQDQTVSPHLH